jgi:hypothetical protein
MSPSTAPRTPTSDAPGVFCFDVVANRQLRLEQKVDPERIAEMPDL